MVDPPVGFCVVEGGVPHADDEHALHQKDLTIRRCSMQGKKHEQKNL